jgi:predicted ATPase
MDKYMAKKLIIKKFLDFENVEIEIKPFTILIGETGTGKSLLAKLVYFFESTYSEYLMSSMTEEKNIEDFKNFIVQNFIEFFPLEYWDNQNIDIVFLANQQKFSISSSLIEKGTGKIKIQ